VPIAPYASWRSPITSDRIVTQSLGLSEIRIDPTGVYWQESRPHESGRSVVVHHGVDLFPAPFSSRTRVHEYGGGAWTVADGVLYFSNDSDQRLYRLAPGSTPVALTPPAAMRYADGLIDPARRSWIGIREDHTAGGEPVNTIVRIDLATGEARTLAHGHDFYSSPRLSPDGRWLAYLAWDHPRMPWVGSTLYIAPLDDPAAPIALAGSDTESIFQPEWSPDGADLVFVSDRTGWGNLYACALDTRQIRPLLPRDAEFAYPQWIFGLSTYAFAGARRIVCSYTSQGLGHLGALSLETGRFAELDLPYSDFSSVRALGNQIVFRAGSSAMPASFLQFSLDTGHIETLQKSTAIADDPALARYFTRVEPIEFPTTKGRTAYGLYYPAFNPDYQAPAGDKPPLVVKCHGGPTAAASSTLDLRIQYWTSRGIAVLDVNYGGSTGFGRAYRERLDGNWGIVDVDDCVAGARFLAERGLVDATRSVITGGSAGGYTTLAALAFRDYFRGGASHYGVADPAALARDTHKFESRYLDGLIGPYPAREDLYRQRSPLAHVESLSVPVIFFQGDEDRVVPPSQSEAMVDALRKKGLPVGYFLFSGEQHGFRKSENIKRSLDAELYFYAINIFHTPLEF
jgi:dipeptidyl aminopeptidase/acylaminoacyl peptidase